MLRIIPSQVVNHTLTHSHQLQLIPSISRTVRPASVSSPIRWLSTHHSFNKRSSSGMTRPTPSSHSENSTLGYRSMQMQVRSITHRANPSVPYEDHQPPMIRPIQSFHLHTRSIIGLPHPPQSTHPQQSAAIISQPRAKAPVLVRSPTDRPKPAPMVGSYVTWGITLVLWTVIHVSMIDESVSQSKERTIFFLRQEDEELFALKMLGNLNWLAALFHYKTVIFKANRLQANEEYQEAILIWRTAIAFSFGNGLTLCHDDSSCGLNFVDLTNQLVQCYLEVGDHENAWSTYQLGKTSGYILRYKLLQAAQKPDRSLLELQWFIKHAEQLQASQLEAEVIKKRILVKDTMATKECWFEKIRQIDFSFYWSYFKNVIEVLEWVKRAHALLPEPK